MRQAVKDWVRRAAAGSLMAVLVSCGGDATGPRPCNTSITLEINVFPDPAPRFEWVPRCLVSELAVFDATTGAEMWTLFSTGGEEPNTIPSGVVYGTVPEDAAESAPAQPLVAGNTYRVTLSATAAGSVDPIGTRTFSP